MNDILKADLNIGLLIAFMLIVGIGVNFMGGQLANPTGAAVYFECSITSDCNDNNACTLDSCFTGNCMYEEIIQCIDNDGCCNKNCVGKDNDCQ